MKAPSSNAQQSSFLLPLLEEQCDPRQALVKRAHEIDWQRFEEAFGEYYSDQGRLKFPCPSFRGNFTMNVDSA